MSAASTNLNVLVTNNKTIIAQNVLKNKDWVHGDRQCKENTLHTMVTVSRLVRNNRASYFFFVVVGFSQLMIL